MPESADTPVFIGDEITAAGYRLAGARIATTRPERAREVFSRERRVARLLLVTAEYATLIPELSRDAARIPELSQPSEQPGAAMVLVVSDARGRASPPDLGAKLRRELGLEQ